MFLYVGTSLLNLTVIDNLKISARLNLFLFISRSISYTIYRHIRHVYVPNFVFLGVIKDMKSYIRKFLCFLPYASGKWHENMVDCMETWCCITKSA